MAARVGDDPHVNSSASLLPDCNLPNCPGICFYGACIPYPPPPAGDIFPVHKPRLLSTFLISAASLVAFSFLLLLLFYFLRLRRRRLIQQQQPQPPPPPLNNDDLTIDDDDTPHHVWLIRTVGLDESIIKSITAAVYKASDGIIDGGDCTVCLGEFVDGEVVKILPKCSHAFHLPCIDTWLRAHVNCPLCRGPVVAAPPPPPPPQTEIQEEESAFVVMDLEAGSSSSNSALEGDESEEVQQPIRRSVSMDSSSLAMVMLRVESEEKLEQVELQRAVGPLKSSSSSNKEKRGKHPGAVEMKRCLSSRSGRMFLSRYRRGRSTSLLPL